jgi:peptidoglycan/LPS O-acetylase OafA/YrhL
MVLAAAPMASVKRAPDHYGYLDGWRGLAILGVLVSHFVFNHGIDLGRLGVEFFFVLSGRLMAGILFEQEIGLRKFYFRRFSRLVPALVVFVFVTAIAASFDKNSTMRWDDIAAALLFLENYQALAHSVPVFDHLWSLAVEEHSYLLLGVVALLARRAGASVIAITATIAILSMFNGAWQTFVLHRSYYQVYWRTESHLSSIFISVATYLYVRTRNVRVAGWQVVLIGLAGMALNVHFVPDPIKMSLGTFCLALTVALLPQAPAFMRDGLGGTWIGLVGALSYSLYLWQQPFARGMFGIPVGPLLILPAAILAMISYRLIERPSRAWLNTWYDRQARSPQASPGGVGPVAPAQQAGGSGF